MSRITVGIIYGGASNEHDASRLTAGQVWEHLDRDRYDGVLLGVDREGGWHRLEQIDGLDSVGAGPSLPDLSGIDLVFPLIHGHNGEDGTLQGMLEMAGVPYVGAGVTASAVGMDKSLCQRVFESHGIPVIPTTVLRAGTRGQAAAAAAGYGYPVFVKPNQSGTSVGVSRVDEPSELEAALEEAFRHDSEVLLQPRIDGREVEIALLQRSDGTVDASPALQVRFDEARPFLDYTAKYTDGMAHYELPAPIPEEAYQRLRDYAIRAFESIRGEGLARVDFFVMDDGAIYLNEINTIPGLTAFSHYPRMWAAAGLSLSELVTEMIERARVARPTPRSH